MLPAHWEDKGVDPHPDLSGNEPCDLSKVHRSLSLRVSGSKGEPLAGSWRECFSREPVFEAWLGGLWHTCRTW